MEAMVYPHYGSPDSGPLPEPAFEADEQIIERCRQTQREWGLPVETR